MNQRGLGPRPQPPEALFSLPRAQAITARYQTRRVRKFQGLARIHDLNLGAPGPGVNEEAQGATSCHRAARGGSFLAQRIGHALDCAIRRDQQNIEAHAPGPMARIHRHPGLGRGHQPGLLAGRQGLGGLTQAGAGFHLDEGEKPVFFGDEIQLARGRADAFGENRPALGAQGFARQGFGGAARAVGAGAAGLAVRQPAPRGSRPQPRGSWRRSRPDGCRRAPGHPTH